MEEDEEQEAKRRRCEALEAELDREFDADRAPMPPDRRRELCEWALAEAHAAGRCAAQQGSLAARRRFAAQTAVLLRLVRPRIVPAGPALLAAADLAVEDVCAHERDCPSPAAPAAAAAAAAAAVAPASPPLPPPPVPPPVPPLEAPPFLETLVEAVGGHQTPGALARLQRLARAHGGAWLAFVAAALPVCHRSPRACAAVAFASRGAPWAALPLPRAAVAAAHVLAAGEPHEPSLAAARAHRRAEAAAALVAPLRALAPHLPRPAWAVLTGCFHPWLVFAAAALVAETRAGPATDTACRDALAWLAAFWFVCPHDAAPGAVDALAAVLVRFVAAAVAAAEPRALLDAPSPLPRYLRVLCANHCHCDPTARRNLLGLLTAPPPPP